MLMRFEIGIACLLLAFALPWSGSVSAAQALGSKNLTRQQSAEVFDKNENYALIVGVDRYDEIGSLKYAVADADALGAFFKAQGYDVEVLRNNGARRKLILNKLRDMAELAGDGSGNSGNVVFAFSGHGFRANGQNYLATVGTELGDITGTGLSLQDVKAVLNSAKVRQRVLLIDACRDDPTSPTKGPLGKQGSFVADQDAEGLAVLYSTGADRRSWEDGSLGQGVFTHYLLQGLKGGAADGQGLVTFDTLQRYVRNRVKRHVRKHFRSVQVPYIGGERTGEFVMAKVEAKDVAKPSVASESKQTPNPEPSPVVVATGRLWVKTQPANARVRIMNIVPKYEDGMELKQGQSYDILASASGYKDWREKVELKGEEQVVAAVLEKLPVKPIAVVKPTPEQETRLSFEPEMLEIPAGSFRMGDLNGGGGPEEKPVHRVSVKGFKLVKTEVTVGQFKAFVEASGYRTEAERNAGGNQGCYAFKSGDDWKWRSGRSWRSPGFTQTDAHPAVCVSWNDAQKYIAWLNRVSKKRYRLPSEAEWEYAARGGTTSKYYFGDNPDELCTYGNVADKTKSDKGNSWGNFANCSDGYFYTAPVGRYQPTWLGLKDMHGNAWEWVQDKYHDSYKGAPSDASAWEAGDESRRVLRGGGWNNPELGLRVAERHGGVASVRYNSTGFRLAEDLPR